MTTGRGFGGTGRTSDAEEFDAFYAACAGRVVGHVYTLTGNRSEAEDAVAEAFTRAWQRWPAVRDADSPEAWVRRVASRIAVSAWRKAFNRIRAHRRAAVDTSVPGLTEDHVALLQALQQLSAVERRAVVLHHLNDMSVADVAAEMAKPVGTVKTYLARGRRAMAGMLTEADHEEAPMAELHDDLTSISDEVQRATKLPPASMLRERGDRRRRRRASVTGAALVVLVVATGTALLRTRETAPDPADSLAPSAVASAAASAGPEEILAGRRQIAIVVPSMGGAVLALGRDDDRVRATTEQGADERAQWVLRPEGNLFRIVLATSRGQVCMTAVHDAAPGSVRGLACAPSAQAQLFRVDREADGSWSLFQGKRYVQVVDGTDALVPDLPEYLTTTYEFQDRGPTAD